MARGVLATTSREYGLAQASPVSVVVVAGGVPVTVL